MAGATLTLGVRRERAQRREPDERSEPAQRRASEAVGESEGRRPSDNTRTRAAERASGPAAYIRCRRDRRRASALRGTRATATPYQRYRAARGSTRTGWR